MNRRSFALLSILSLAACRVLLAAEDDDSRLSLSDLAPYRAALEKSAGPGESVTFRELWDHPDRYRGRRVRVEGRVVRRFKQGPIGTFPPLVEVWAVSTSGDPFCLVFPVPAGVDSAKDAAPGASVCFDGTFLRRLRYQGGDADRLAPLIVGDRPPSVTIPAPPKSRLDSGPTRDGRSWLGWTFGLVAASIIALALARRHLNGPPRRPLRVDQDDGPPPEFIDHA